MWVHVIIKTRTVEAGGIVLKSVALIEDILDTRASPQQHMKRTVFWILVSIVAFGLGFASAYVWLYEPNTTHSDLADGVAEQPILAYCELANNPEKYDGKVVRVSARLWFMRHGYSFYSRNCEGETKQTAVVFRNDESGERIEARIAQETGLNEYNPWGFPEIIASGKFSRVQPSRKSDSMEDNTYLHFELSEVEKASAEPTHE